MKIKLAFSVLLLTLSFASYGWEATGHILVANLAYKKIDKTVIDKLNTILQNADDNLPETNSFVTASVWADIIKKRGNKLYNSWHYQDLFYSNDGTKIPKKQSDGQAMDMLKKSKKILISSSTTPSEKAFALKMFIHIYGDMHQPLHNATRVSADFSKGDMRGKLFTLKGKYSDLHSLWDNGLGILNYDLTLPLDRAELIWLDQYSDNLLVDFPASSFAKEEIVVKSKVWHLDHFKLAQNKLYKNIAIDTIPSEEYINNNTRLMRRQLALGGLRLANQMNCLYGSDQCIS